MGDKFHGEWLKTGDIAVITEREQVVMALPEVAMAAVVAVPHPKWDERPVVICSLQNGSDGLAMKEKVLKHLIESGRFSKFQIPDDVLIWNEIPVTGTGKMSKKMIREKLKKMNYVLPSIKRSKL